MTVNTEVKASFHDVEQLNTNRPYATSDDHTEYTTLSIHTHIHTMSHKVSYIHSHH
eukprot:COSAG01_NODE_1351_length_10617_cov_4.243392_3_plen_56_part_00